MSFCQKYMVYSFCFVITPRNRQPHHSSDHFFRAVEAGVGALEFLGVLYASAPEHWNRFSQKRHEKIVSRRFFNPLINSTAIAIDSKNNRKVDFCLKTCFVFLFSYSTWYSFFFSSLWKIYFVSKAHKVILDDLQTVWKAVTPPNVHEIRKSTFLKNCSVKCFF